MIHNEQDKLEVQQQLIEKVKNLCTIPDDFLCPIGLTLLKDPVVAKDCITYSRANIIEWFTNSNISPKTQLPITHDIIDTFSMKSIVSNYVESVTDDIIICVDELLNHEMFDEIFELFKFTNDLPCNQLLQKKQEDLTQFFKSTLDALGKCPRYLDTLNQKKKLVGPLGMYLEGEFACCTEINQLYLKEGIRYIDGITNDGKSNFDTLHHIIVFTEGRVTDHETFEAVGTFKYYSGPKRSCIKNGSYTFLSGVTNRLEGLFDFQNETNLNELIHGQIYSNNSLVYDGTLQYYDKLKKFSFHEGTYYTIKKSPTNIPERIVDKGSFGCMNGSNNVSLKEGSRTVNDTLYRYKAQNTSENSHTVSMELQENAMTIERRKYRITNGSVSGCSMEKTQGSSARLYNETRVCSLKRKRSDEPTMG